MSKAINEKISPVIQALPEACANEAKAVEFLEKLRWDDLPSCPRCGCVDVYKMKSADGTRNKRFLWRCTACKRQYTVRTGTVIEESRIPLRHWCFALWRSATSKKGVSALEIKRQTGISYKSALFMLHRIRFAMEPKPPKYGNKLNGTVEADEVYIGGKPRNKGPWNKRGTGTKKQCVAVLIERGGRARAYTVPDVSALTLQGPIRHLVDSNANMMTDENKAYHGLGYWFKSHETVHHGSKEYVRGNVHTNSAESFNALFKRGIHGIYHSVSKKHLHRYLSEFMFRYDHREMTDGERVVAIIRATIGKRLMYKDPVGKAGQTSSYSRQTCDPRGDFDLLRGFS
jgi:transposase-like protein